MCVKTNNNTINTDKARNMRYGYIRKLHYLEQLYYYIINT